MNTSILRRERTLSRRFHSRGLTNEVRREFQRLVLSYYRLHGRSFPWRQSVDPYHVLVSEIMLQQTQTSRVIPKYDAFLSEFPSVFDLAGAANEAVLRQWQGLGYNRRGLMLKRAAEALVQHHDGNMPSDERTLMALPGIGAYTAAAVRAFAFDLPAVVLDTNVRRVFIHIFFSDAASIHDREILPLVTRSMYGVSPCRWYNALMDYGAMLAGRGVNPNRRSAHYVKQSRFEGSVRQVRGKVLRALLQHGPMSFDVLCEAILIDREQLKLILERMIRDGLVVFSNEAAHIYSLDSSHL